MLPRMFACGLMLATLSAAGCKCMQRRGDSNCCRSACQQCCCMPCPVPKPCPVAQPCQCEAPKPQCCEAPRGRKVKRLKPCNPPAPSCCCCQPCATSATAAVLPQAAPVAPKTAEPAKSPAPPPAKSADESDEPPVGVLRFHNEDYSILVGELHHNPRTGAWRLRFADVDIVDSYGGSVTLMAVGRLLDGLKTGQVVRIDGQLLDRESREISPAYRVFDLSAVSQ